MIQKAFLNCAITALALLTILVGCSKDSEQQNKVEGQSRELQPLAIVGERAVGVDELKAYIEQRQGQGASLQSFDKALDELTLAEQLYQEAISRGIDKKPEMRQALRQLLGQELINELVSRPVQLRQIPEEELHQYYDQHQNLFSRPEQIRLADIFIATSARLSSQQKAELKRKADDVLFQSVALAHERFGFSRLTRDYSDKHPDYKLGDIGWFGRKGQPGTIAEELIAAGFSMEKPGDVFPEVIQTVDGFHIIKLIGRREAFSRSFEDVTGEIEQRIRQEEQRVKREELFATIRQKHKIEIDQKVLENTRQYFEKNVQVAEITRQMSNRPVLPGQ